MTKLPILEKNYLTIDGDVVDRICWIFYGYSDGSTEAVFRRNPILANLPSRLPAGVIIILPNYKREEARRQLWDYVSAPQPRAISLPPSQIESDLAALRKFQSDKAQQVFIGFKPDDLYVPDSTVIPSIIGTPAGVFIPPVGGEGVSAYPPTAINAFDYVAVYYRTEDNVLRVGYVTKEQFKEGTVTDVLVSGIE